MAPRQEGTPSHRRVRRSQTTYQCVSRREQSCPLCSPFSLPLFERSSNRNALFLFLGKASIPVIGMQEYTTLEQRKTRLPIRTAFDCFDFIHKALNHAVAAR